MSISGTQDPTVNEHALRSDIIAAIVNKKAVACPMAVRLAWHASGNYSAAEKNGGSNGGRMRFDPEASDGANAGLGIARNMMEEVKAKHPDVSYADIYAFAGAVAIEYMGGPKIEFRFGRSDDNDGKASPAPGRLPDAAQGVQHLRDVFHRMGFSDQDIVALSGAHSVGSCHRSRSGFDGPWTKDPLRFDNEYFKLLLTEKWTERQWDGPKQYQDSTGTLMMLPSDLALLDEPEFKKWVETYAADQNKFFQDFAAAFSRLLHLGCNLSGDEPLTAEQQASADFRAAAQHGSFEVMKQLASKADIHSAEKNSRRTALHKAAYWGHVDPVKWLLENKVAVNAQDYNGDTALHDAARIGHADVVQLLVAAGADRTLKNQDGRTAADVAAFFKQQACVDALQ